ncbi:kinase-like domain-containing protein [Rhizophagus irregularis DAOM 181602=DAOM 197198]|nr:kinase-like domain-containing protein [Rhizophagus irregularis DAOM 181602=DAOM 197198]
MSNKQINSKNINFSNTNILLQKFSQAIQNFNKMNIEEIEPTIKNINKYVFDGDFNIVIDELVNLIFNELNKGEDTNVIKQQVLDYINNQMINLKQIYIWLLNNQNNSNSICLLGYFNYHGIETELNELKAMELYQNAAELENRLAQLNLVNEHLYGQSSNKNYNLAFELSKKLAEEEYASAMNNLGFCYDTGIGTYFNGEKAFKFYQKAAELGNLKGMVNLGCCYYEGIGTDTNEEKAFELYQKAADLGSIDGIISLGWCYNKGIGTEVNKQKYNND